MRRPHGEAYWRILSLNLGCIINDLSGWFRDESCLNSGLEAGSLIKAQSGLVLPSGQEHHLVAATLPRLGQRGAKRHCADTFAAKVGVRHHILDDAIRLRAPRVRFGIMVRLQVETTRPSTSPTK